jgi:hypothetical protein
VGLVSATPLTRIFLRCREGQDGSPILEYRDPAWLRQKYTAENLSSRQIARLCNTGKTTILRWLRRLRIPIKEDRDCYVDRNFDVRNKKWLEQKYLKEKKSILEIAALRNVSEFFVRYWLHKHNINVRPKGSAPNHLNLSERAVEFLVGLVLGDGSLDYHNGKTSACYRHSDKHKDYLEWLSRKLRDFGIKTTEKITKRKHIWGYSFSYTYAYRSKSYLALRALRDNIYQDGRKVIQKNLKIAPTIMFNWYIGDGTLCTGKGCQICAFSFSVGELIIIIKQLTDLGITCSINKQGIYIWKESLYDFFDYILSSGLRPPCYAYKFPEEYRGEFP